MLGDIGSDAGGFLMVELLVLSPIRGRCLDDVGRIEYVVLLLGRVLLDETVAEAQRRRRWRRSGGVRRLLLAQRI